MRTLNVWLAIGLIAGGLVLGGGVYFLHGFQVKRHAGAFLDAARSAKEQKKFGEAGTNYQCYILLVHDTPEAADALEELAKMIADHATDLRTAGRALAVYEELLRQDPNRLEARRRAIQLAMGTRDYSTAKTHIKFLLEQSPEDAATLHDQLGECQMTLGEDADALKSFQEAIRLAPGQLDAYADLAHLLRFRFGKSVEADRQMAEMAKNNSKSARAHYLYGRYLLKSVSNVAKASEEVEKARKLAPNDRDVLWLAAECELTDHRDDQAKADLEQRKKLYKSDPMVYLQLAEIDSRAGKPEAAIAILRQGLEPTKHHVDVVWTLANRYLESQKFKEVREMVEELRTAKVDFTRVAYLEAGLLCAQGKWAPALQALEKLRLDLAGSANMRRQSDFSSLQRQVEFWIAHCYHHSNNTDREIDAYQRALLIDPRFVQAHVMLSNIYMTLNKPDLATAELRQAAPYMGGAALLPLAKMLIFKNQRMKASKRDWETVERVLDEAGARMPTSPQVPLLQAQVQYSQGQVAKAERLLEDGQQKYPKVVDFPIALCKLAQGQGRWDQAEKVLNDAQQLVGDQVLLRLARAEYLVKRYHEEAAERLKKLAEVEKTDTISPTDQIQLWNGLIVWSLQVNDVKQARWLADKVAEKLPDDVRAQYLPFELALRAQDYAHLDDILAKVEKAGGKGPMWSYGKAVCLCLPVHGNDDASKASLRKRKSIWPLRTNSSRIGRGRCFCWRASTISLARARWP